jgi:hypothetical protein
MVTAITPHFDVPARRGDDRRYARRQPPEVYRRRRIVVFGLLAFLLVALWLGVQGLMGSSRSSALPASRAIAARQWIVRPGDTLWSIALASGDRGDLRPLVDQLSAEVNGQPLQVGESISLP